MGRKIRRVTLSEDAAERTADALRRDPVLKEYLSEDRIERLAEHIVGEGVPTVTIDAETGEVVDEQGDRTGKTLEELAGERPFGMCILPASDQQLTLDVGLEDLNDRELMTSGVKLKGYDRNVRGQYALGETVRFEVEATITHVAFERITDAQGYVVGIKRHHTAEVQGMEAGTPVS